MGIGVRALLRNQRDKYEEHWGLGIVIANGQLIDAMMATLS